MSRNFAMQCMLIMAISVIIPHATTSSLLSQEKLNVVLILVDDLGWMDLSCQGSDYFQTPNIDRLAREGIRFTNAYAACAVCSPTRAAVMTGKSPARTGITDWIRARFQRGGIGTPDKNPTQYVGGKNQPLLCPPNPYWLEHEEITIAELLSPSGYTSCHIGKWHLGDPAWYPTSQGFDVNIAGCDIGQPPSYFDPYEHPNYSLDGQLSPRKEGEFLTHREGYEARKFIQQHKDKPFFVYYCPYAVHTPIQAIPEVAAKYKRDGKTDINAKYAAMVESVDDAVGTILQTLEEEGLAQKTLVIFTSDNGGLIGPTDNAPLRSGKGYAYEGGVRVPLIVRWPGKVPAGSVSNAPVTSVDLLPTVAEAIGVEPANKSDIDGVSLVTHMQNPNSPLNRKALFWHFPHYRHPPGPYSIIRQGDWKLIHWYEGITEVYNLAEDLSEQHNLADSHPDHTQRLKAALDQELERVGAKLPIKNPAY